MTPPLPTNNGSYAFHDNYNVRYMYNLSLLQTCNCYSLGKNYSGERYLPLRCHVTTIVTATKKT
jgi:hypothetical protein